MRLSALADAFARLEASSRRLSAIETLTALLGAAGPAEREMIVYLLQGQLRPPYEGVEFGVGEQLLVRAIAHAYGETQPAVTRAYKRLGDLGLVAESLAGRAPRAGLTLARAYDALMAIARASGAGSVERKVRLVSDLLRAAGAREARYLVRIVQGRLRLGVGDATVIEAAAAGALGDRRKKEIVATAYNVRSDLGAVVRLAYQGGARAMARITPRVGTPVRPALAQRLPSAQSIIHRLGRVDAEPKYDGFRIQLHREGRKVWAFSRRLEDVSAMFPELAAGARKQLRARRAIIEGEAVVYDPRTRHFEPFQVTMTRKRTHGVAEAAARHPLKLFAFDLLLLDGEDWLRHPMRARHARLAKLVRGGARGPIAVTEVLTTDSPAELERYFREMLRRGLEGIVAKRPDAPYRAGARGFDWVKLKRAYQSKMRDTVDLVLVGYLKGRGKRASLGIGSLLAAVYDPDGDRFRTVAKIGSGPSEAEWKALRKQLDARASRTRPKRVDSLIEPDVWVEPSVVVEVLADEITRSPLHTCGRGKTGPGYALRFPRMLDGVRTDKAPADATTEREVLELFRMQRRAGRRRGAEAQPRADSRTPSRART